MSPKKTSYPKQGIHVLLLEGVSQTAIDTFRAAGYSQIEAHAKALPEEQLIERIARWARPLTAIAGLCAAVFGAWKVFRGGGQ